MSASSPEKVVVTGGTGFIGSYLAKELLDIGYHVTIVDNLTRGDKRRVNDRLGDIEIVEVDVRDQALLTKAIKGASAVFHLAAVNGTENFYKNPELVLDVGVRGALAVVCACRDANVEELVVASSAEVYQQPPMLPTPEEVPLQLPNSTNARYSYGGSKIATELIAMNYGRDFFKKVQVFRPHNVYGPDMGWKHAIPQFIMRGKNLVSSGTAESPIPFEIIGSGDETRAFAYVSDVVDGIILMFQKGGNREIYNIGSEREVKITELVNVVADYFKVDFHPVASEIAEGAASRRCPKLDKIKALGYEQTVSLEDGIRKTADWYTSRSDLGPLNSLM